MFQLSGQLNIHSIFIIGKQKKKNKFCPEWASNPWHLRYEHDNVDNLAYQKIAKHKYYAGK